MTESPDAQTRAQAELAQRLADLQRRHPTPAPAPQVAPTTVPCSVRTASPGVAPKRMPTFDVRIHGEAVTDAIASIERGSGTALLTVIVQQRFDALPVVATRRYDDTASSHAVARSLARRIRHGTVIDVRGEGLCLTEHDKKPVLRVLNVQAIDPPPEPTTRKDLA